MEKIKAKAQNLLIKHKNYNPIFSYYIEEKTKTESKFWLLWILTHYFPRDMVKEILYKKDWLYIEYKFIPYNILNISFYTNIYGVTMLFH